MPEQDQSSGGGWLGSAWQVAVDTFTAFQRNQAPLMAAGLAYYLLISVSPLFVVGVAVTGLILGRAEAQDALLHRVNDLFGAGTGETIEAMVRDVSWFSGGIVASLIAFAVLFYGSTRSFAALQRAFDVIWDVPPSTSIRKGIVQVIRSRLISFLMVLLLGVLLLATMMLETIGSTVELAIERYTTLDPQLGSLGNRLIAILIRALGLALVYHQLPSRRVDWRDVVPAAVVAAVLLSFGHTLIGLYVTHSGVRSAYGAAGSIMVLLFAFYYAAFVTLLGAQLASVWAARRR